MDFSELVIYQKEQIPVSKLIEQGIIQESYYTKLLLFNLSSQEIVDTLLLMQELLIKKKSLCKILKKLGLSVRMFHRYKKKGMSDVEAFEYCLFYIKKYQKTGIYKRAKELGVCAKSFDIFLKEGLSEEDAISNIFTNQMKKQLQKEKNISLGLDEGASIIKYCLDNQINYRIFLSLIDKGMNIEEATEAYNRRKIIYRPSRYEFWGIPLKSICLKYSLNYDRYCKLLNQGKSNMEAMRFSLINSLNFISKEKYFIKSIWEFIECIPLERFMDIRTIFLISDEFYEQLFILKEKYERIKQDFAYFELHYLIEKNWPSLYHDVLKDLKENSSSHEEYMIGFRKIEQMAKEEIIASCNLKQGSIQSIYEDLFSDFEYLPKHGVWVYQKRQSI